MDLLTAFGLQALAKRPSFKLSGGERRRAALARALSHAPDLILADEPVAGIQPKLARSITEMLRECTAEGCGVLFTTHDPSLMAIADRTVVLEDGILKERQVSSFGASLP
jgi:ABC-type lipoprotein export system ATPase subunit